METLTKRLTRSVERLNAFQEAKAPDIVILVEIQIIKDICEEMLKIKLSK